LARYDYFVNKNLPPDEESIRLELGEAIATFRDQAGRATQGIGIIVTADSVLLAYGFSQRESGILLVASLMPLFGLIAFFHFLRISTPLIYVAVVLERRLRLYDAPLMWIHAKRGYKKVYDLVSNAQDAADEDVTDSVLAISYRDWINLPEARVLYSIFAGQLILFLVSAIAYNYRFM
jgi:hypothetical protein